MTTSTLIIRKAAQDDIPLLLELIGEIAQYEKLTHMMVNSKEKMEQTLFSDNPHAKVLIAETGEFPVGYCIYFYSYSSFLGQYGIFIEDIFIREHLRGQGFGKQLFQFVIEEANQQECGRVEWSVLNWNTPAIEFYEAHGAKPLDEWTMYRLSGDALKSPKACSSS